VLICVKQVKQWIQHLVYVELEKKTKQNYMKAFQTFSEKFLVFFPAVKDISTHLITYLCNAHSAK